MKMTEDNQQLESLIVASRNKFRALVDGIEDGVMSIGPDYRIATVNQSLADELGRHPKDVVDRFCYELLYGYQSPCPENGRPCPAAAAWESGELEMADHATSAPPEEGGREIEIRAMPVPSREGPPSEMVLVRRDMTLQREAARRIAEHNEILEREVAARTAELVETNEELVNLQKLKEDLINMVVHDLKGPLSEIQANLEMMEMQPLDDLVAEFAEAAKMGGNDLLRMITNLLDISRMEEDRMVLDPEPFNVKRMLDDIRDRYRPVARLKEINLNTDPAGDMPQLVADRRLFERIMSNLISNALDHTPEHGRVLVRAAFRDGGFRFEVLDTGGGVPPDLRESIFDKFSQGKKGSSKSSAGLGLTFCRMAVEAHGGVIRVEDGEEGTGSAFVFELPRTRRGADGESPDD
jgi:signal transduction histidine kinase